MLIQYSVENYMSIKDELIINFSADRKRLGSKWIVDTYKDKIGLYKCIGLVGPNASGKTNIIRSLLFALKFIEGTISRREAAKIHVEGFRFDPEYNEKPTCFEFIFYQHAIKYVYGFSVNEEEVVEEYLMGYFSSEPKTIFDRTEGQCYNFKGNDIKTQTEISKKTNKNRLYMPVAAEWGYEPLKIVYEWFNLVSRQYYEFSVNTMLSNIIKKEDRKELLIRELQKADFNIHDIYIQKRKVNRQTLDIAEKIIAEFFSASGDVPLPEERPIIRIVHENSSGEQIDLPLDEDSAGTLAIVENIAELMYLGESGGLMLEDELGKVYHTKLTQHFLDMVKNPFINTGNAQLLFSSHDTKILNLLNHDQIYLVDKDENGGTYVTLLDDFELRENENIELGYLKGRYGAIPYMKG